MAPDHYFSQHPTAPGEPRTFTATLRGHTITLTTEPAVFSRTRVDRGSRLLIKHMEVGEEDRFLDLGCGYGAVGIVAALLAPTAQVTLLDINLRAVALAVVHRLIEQSPGYLPPDGRFYLVARTKQGAVRLAEKMSHTFGAAEEVAKGGGYRLYLSHRP